jgi:hypothetical protein
LSSGDRKDDAFFIVDLAICKEVGCNRSLRNLLDVGPASIPQRVSPAVERKAATITTPRDPEPSLSEPLRHAC